MNICKRLLLEVFYKNLFLKTLQYLQDESSYCKFSEEKMFLVVDIAVKVTCFYIDQHLL